MQARFTITHRSYTGSTDDDGYPTGDAYGDPVERPVYGWYPLSSQLDAGGQYDRRVITSRVLQVPDVTPYSPRDRVALPGDDVDDDSVAFYVSEDVRDYSTGPFGFKPSADAAAFGEVILERVTG